MHSEASNDLAAFVHFAQGQLRSGENDLSPEECLLRYRGQTASPADIAALREALDAMHRGDTGIPLDEFDREFRRTHGIAARE